MTSNHWILALRTPQGIKFLPWDWGLAVSDNIIILCGEGCAAALLSRSLGEWKHNSLYQAKRSTSAAA